MVAQQSLNLFVMVRIHVGQPLSGTEFSKASVFSDPSVSPKPSVFLMPLEQPALVMPTFDFLKPFGLRELWVQALSRAPLAVFPKQNSPTTSDPPPTTTTAVATDALADHGVVGHTTATLLG
jgi:hypothetical protein